jgi:hypothetical protein
MIDINKFLQLNNPDIARQTRNMSYFDALKSEIPGTKSYQGYNPFYKGADKTGLGGYLKQGIDSVQGKFKPGSEPKTGIMNIETPKGFDYNFDENVLKEEEDAQYNLDNKRSFNMDGMLQNLGGYAKDAAGRYIGLEALGGAGTMIGGPVVGGIAALAGLVGGGNLFNSPYIGAGAYTMDQYGNMYTADQLNKMNARGGYYSEPARDSRRRDQSIRRMEERKAQGLQYGINRLEELKEQAAQEEAARQSAVDNYFGGSDAGADKGRFDGASSRSEYDANPTGYSGPF